MSKKNTQRRKRQRELVRRKKRLERDRKSQALVKYADPLDYVRFIFTKFGGLANPDFTFNKEYFDWQVEVINATLGFDFTYYDGRRIQDWWWENFEGVPKGHSWKGVPPIMAEGAIIHLSLKLDEGPGAEVSDVATDVRDDILCFMGATKDFDSETYKFTTAFVLFVDGRLKLCPFLGFIEVDQTSVRNFKKEGWNGFELLSVGTIYPKLDDEQYRQELEECFEIWNGFIDAATLVSWWVVAFAEQKSVIKTQHVNTRKAEQWRKVNGVPAISKTVLDIGPTAPPKEEVVVKGGKVVTRSRKRGTAYHSARAHWRQLPNGKRRWIPLCWKGDPAYGVVTKKYNVRRPSE